MFVAVYWNDLSVDLAWTVLYNASQRDPAHLDWMLGLGKLAHKVGNDSLALGYYAKACALAHMPWCPLVVVDPVSATLGAVAPPLAGLGAQR